MGLLTKSVFKIEPFYKVLKNGHCFVILSQLCRKNLLDFSEQVLCQQTQHGQKSIGFGGTPTSIFAERKSQVSIHLPCLPLTRFSRNSHKNVVVFLLCCWPFNYRISQPYSVFCALFLCGYVVAQDTHIYLRN